jgi:beta-lactamase superfamily II metal-dependent hydrolase
VALMVLVLVGCAADSVGGDASARADGSSAPDALLVHDAAATDARGPDPDARADAGVDTTADASGDAEVVTDAASADVGPVPDGGLPRCASRSIVAPPLVPQLGELYLAHLGLEGLSIGEATLVQLPDGTRGLIDVGNDSHARDVVAAVDALLGTRALDLVVLTHHHADHEDALPDLLEALTIGTLVHRGLTDLTAAANEATVGRVCAARARTTEVELCPNPDRACTPAAWSWPATACPNLPYVAGAGALTLLAANATVDGQSLRPLQSDDNNGENARSVVGVLAHGAFRYVFAGDLTGGGSDTDAAEAFVVAQLGPRLPPADVLHLSHHARDTSSSNVWLQHLLPADGRPRQAVAGISQLHVGSPHAVVVRAVSARLAGGRIFVSRVAATGAGSGVVDARGGSVRVQTFGGGAGYRVQAVDEAGVVVETIEATSASACTP